MKPSKNNRNIYIDKHLPKIGAELKKEASKQGFITSTKNCKICVLISKANNTIGYQCIIYRRDLVYVPNPYKRKDACDKRKLENDNDWKLISSPDMKRVNQQKTRAVNQKQHHDCVLFEIGLL